MSDVKHTFAVCAYKETYLEEAVKSVIHQPIKSKVYILKGTPNDHISNIAAKYWDAWIRLSAMIYDNFSEV